MQLNLHKLLDSSSTAEQLSVVGVGTSHEGVRVFRKFFERPYGDANGRREERRDEILDAELP